MSRTYRGRLKALAAAVFVLSLAAVASAQQRSDPLEQYKERMAVAVQKLENEVREAVTAAQKLLPTDPPRQPRNCARADQGRGRQVPQRRPATALRATSGPHPARRGDGLAQGRPRRHERSEVSRRGPTGGTGSGRRPRRVPLSNIRELQRQGKLAEANRLADEVARRYPNNPAATAAGRTGRWPIVSPRRAS
jgi:hypothetical protein